MKAQKIVSFGEQGSSLSAEPIQLNGAQAQQTGKVEAAGAVSVMTVGQLRPHPLIADIYDSFHADKDGLLESIRSQGILTPLIVTSDGTVLAGAERLRVAELLGTVTVPVRIIDLTDTVEIEATVIESNVARQKTVVQRIREYRHLKNIEATKALARKGTRTDLPKNLPVSEPGDARDLAAVKVGWSGRTAEKAAQVLTAIETHDQAGGNMQNIEEVRATLNERSVDAAYQKATAFGWLEDRSARRKAEHRSTPERRIAVVYKQAAAAVTKAAYIFRGEDAAKFSPEQIRYLHEALMPVLKWVDGLDRP